MHAFANPRRFLAIAMPLTPWCFWGGIALILAGCWAGLFRAPADYLQGESFRIIYIHVPTAWLGMGGWSGMTIAAIMQLVWRHPLAGIAGKAIAVPGAVATALCLATGSIWGRPTWGTWWEWDGRMTSMLLLLFLYIGYIALARSSADRGDAGGVSRVTAIYALVGALNLPIIHYSVVWWNSLHQGRSITLSGSSIAGSMLWPLGLTVVGFTAWFAAIVLLRMRAILAENRIEARLRRMSRS
ncbi:cytochrome c-type biogenesis protein CcmC [Sphingobium sp. SYK-6]|uniref:heme ABC transporter permease CcmC n=1 Tax=Sphingobium sp. (strain NBRC 103272 / SYK-6) TaxID=627192 RepID=UPI0002276FDF|nr:heme ABC transporter permease CcmC [Sphingobium sp. SYK-6]BAK66287.1 cytochrome c-type biogenesis protein CcmC [Sphingobium sp. SYK-6]